MAGSALVQAKGLAKVGACANLTESPPFVDVVVITPQGTLAASLEPISFEEFVRALLAMRALIMGKTDAPILPETDPNTSALTSSTGPGR